MITNRDLVQFFYIWTGAVCFCKLTFSEKSWLNFNMFCNILSPWKWLECFSKMSVLEKLKSQFEQLCGIFFEWTDSRCSYNSLFSEKALSQIEILFNFSIYWCSMLLQIDFFRKVMVTILACFLTSCSHENDWNVFPKCLF